MAMLRGGGSGALLEGEASDFWVGRAHSTGKSCVFCTNTMVQYRCDFYGSCFKVGTEPHLKTRKSISDLENTYPRHRALSLFGDNSEYETTKEKEGW